VFPIINDLFFTYIIFYIIIKTSELHSEVRQYLMLTTIHIFLFNCQTF